MMTGPGTGSQGAAVVLPARDHIRSILDSQLQRWKPEILDLSHSIHADPELGGQEFRAVKRVQKVLQKSRLHPG